MIPSILARQIQRGIEDFLSTTFPISTPFFEPVLKDFIASPNTLFRGPFVSVKLPYRQVLEGADPYFPGILPDGFRPYVHQQRAFERLDYRKGEATIVSSGTGSGKTESFFYPILDYCLAQAPRRGIKAILVYPMNALATDQARRLAQEIYRNPKLKNIVTAGLYIGDSEGQKMNVMTEDELVTDRDALRNAPPDILLTNYKMLDLLLLRPDDFRLWSKNEPRTLKYLVVDELHSFDGAQGTDLACLIRRLKERVKTPEGHLIGVGTSATLGGSGDLARADMAKYASQVFGEACGPESVIGESVKTFEEFLAGSDVKYRGRPTSADMEAMNPLQYETQAAFVAAQRRLWFGNAPGELSECLRSHAFLRVLLSLLQGKPVAWEHLRESVSVGDNGLVDAQLASFLALLSSARDGHRPFVQVRVEVWLRELARMVSRVGQETALRFADDLKPDDLKRSLPLVYCRDCGLTGWAGKLKDPEKRFEADLRSFYDAYFREAPQVQFVFPGVEEGKAQQQQFQQWLCSDCLSLEASNEPEECGKCGALKEQMVSVWAPDLTKRIKKRDGTEKVIVPHHCPSCESQNALTLLGSRAASLTSVAIAQLFASPYNDDKKLLTFSDNVQDASHRAAFFGARTYVFNLRGAIQKTLLALDGPIPLEELTAKFCEHWRAQLGDAEFVATFLPPDMGGIDDYEVLRKKGKLPAGSQLMRWLEQRLGWEIWKEYTLNCRIGRTLEKAGASVAGIAPEVLNRAVALLVRRLESVGELRQADADRLRRFALGFLVNLKNRGGVFQPEADKYVETLGNYWELGKNNGQRPWRPAVGKNSRLPAFLSNRPSERFQSVIRGPQQATRTFSEDWFERCFAGIDPNLTTYVKEAYDKILPALIEAGLVEEREGRGARVWGINPAALRVGTEVLKFRCRLCRYGISAAEDLIDAPCLKFRCKGTLAREEADGNYYRKLYETGNVKRVFAAEHTGLLARDVREEVEDQFKSTSPHAGDVNLLSSTPTLEMGIDIGSLSSLILCSIPPKPSNYLQRVGRAGRRDGNSFVLTVANARPHDLYFYNAPAELLDGNVERPGCFLNASAVLERQFTAYVFDRWVETGIGAQDLPRELRGVLNAVESNNRDSGFPGNYLKFLDSRRGEFEDGFLRMFGEGIEPHTRTKLIEFSRGTSAEHPGLELTLWHGLDEKAKERESMRKTVVQLTTTIRNVKNDPASGPNSEEDIKNMEREKAGLNALLTDINEKNVLNFFTDEGLLPNYAFPEAGVSLRSVIYRRKAQVGADGKKYAEVVVEYERPASAAISELAPANDFYAEGRKLQIDQVNLRMSDFENWLLCRNCSYMEKEATGVLRVTCPRCGDGMFTDSGQRKLMLKMRQVFSTMPEETSRVYDDSDNREPAFYERGLFVDALPDYIEEAYFIDKEDLPFGYESYRKVTLREINFGDKGAGGSDLTVAGRKLNNRPFAICRSCGKVKKGKDINHAPYCKYWKKPEKEQVIETSYLYREFSSEAIRILLPVLFEADRAVESFVAALELGLRLKFGGDPGHLHTASMDEPIPGNDLRKRFLVIYDGVPGGTGYLKELTREQGTLFEVFQLAYDKLTNCKCGSDLERDGCYACLLAYRERHHAKNTSRAAALELLGRILENQRFLKRTDRLASVRMNTLLESELERLFVEALRQSPPEGTTRRLTQEVVNGKAGFSLQIGDERYEIEPQVEIGPADGVSIPSRADFVIRALRPFENERPIAIYTDGFEFHADPGANMRTADDVAKRMSILEGARFWVWTLTWDEIKMQTGSFARLMDLLGPRRAEVPNPQTELPLHAPAAFMQFGIEGSSVRLTLQDDRAGEDGWRDGWREYWRWWNILQFVSGFEGMSQIGQQQHDSEASRPVATAPDRSVSFDSPLSAWIQHLLAVGIATPEIGYELPDESGAIVGMAELGWPTQKVAVVMVDQSEQSSVFITRDWKVFIGDGLASTLSSIEEYLRLNGAQS